MVSLIGSMRQNAFSFILLQRLFFRRFSTRQKPKPDSYLFRPTSVSIVDEIGDKLKSEQMKYRHHPGVFSMPVQSVDPQVALAIGRVLATAEPVSVHKTRGREFERRMQNRRLPAEPYDIKLIRRNIEHRVREAEAKKGRTPENCETDDQRASLEEHIQQKVDNRAKTSVYNWRGESYDSPSKCLTYCVTRFAPEYAVLRRVFHEIAKKEPEFKPRHLFDFGCGVGTVFFASESTWPKDTVEEYVCVDSSQDMNDFFHSLLRGGDGKGELCHQNVTVRPFLSATSERQFDVVVSAYSLFELPSYEDRMRTVVNLWLKAKDFLILVERGTNAGFRAVVEARDYILACGHEIHRRELLGMAQDKELDLSDIDRLLRDKSKTESEKFRVLREKYPNVEFPTILPHGHVFAPCPHDMGCPRLMDVTPCNFAIRYFPLRLSGGANDPETELFSFIILRKGYAPSPEDRWPRLVREPRKSKSCVWCQTCSSNGVLEDMPFHKGKASTDRGTQFRMTKFSSWGDLLPISTSYKKGEESDSLAETDTKS